MLLHSNHPCWSLLFALHGCGKQVAGLTERMCEQQEAHQSTSMTDITCLPGLVLERVLSFLDTRSKCCVLCVSKEWQRACGQSEHWRNIEISCSSGQQAPTAAELYNVFHRSQGHVLRLVLSSAGKSRRAQEQKRFELGFKREQPLPDTRGTSAVVIASIMPKLQQLVLDERASSIGGMTDDFAKALATTCTSLQYLEVLFQRYSLPSELFTDVGMMALVESCRNLRVITLKNCTSITDRSLYAIAACKQLQEFSFGGYSERVTDGGLTILFEACSSLRKVRLCSKLFKVTDVSVEALAQHCKQLQVVKLPSQVTDVAVTELANKCPALEEMDLKKCFQVSQKVATMLLMVCRNLKHLTLPANAYVLH